MIRVVNLGKKIADYQNGNVHTELYADGTKIHTSEDETFIPKFAESVDVHISSRCDNMCPMCYANCTVNGDFGDLSGKWLDTVHAGTEMAVNLNFPVSPEFVNFAKRMKDRGIILNATVNQRHFEENEEFIRGLYSEELIKGLGVSLTNPSEEFISRIQGYPNAVIHVITGIFSQVDYEALRDKGLKILILGYKHKGRGVKYNSDNGLDVSMLTNWLQRNLREIFEGFDVVSFDNLALDQLNVRELMSDAEWEEVYCGNDGTFSFFINTVDNYFAKNSLSEIHYPIDDMSIDDMFRVVRNESSLAW